MTQKTPPVVRYTVRREKAAEASGFPWVVTEYIDGLITNDDKPGINPRQFTSAKQAYYWVGLCLDHGTAPVRQAMEKWALEQTRDIRIPIPILGRRLVLRGGQLDEENA